MTRILALIPAAALATVACTAEPSPANKVEQTIAAGGERPRGTALPPPEFDTVPPSETARATDGWLGRWIAQEGLFLDVAAREDGRYDLTMRYTLDDEGTFVGTGEGDMILFERGGVAERLVPGTGEETGLRWLAGKRDCLVVKPGEGYCRD